MAPVGQRTSTLLASPTTSALVSTRPSSRNITPVPVVVPSGPARSSRTMAGWRRRTTAATPASAASPWRPGIDMIGPRDLLDDRSLHDALVELAADGEEPGGEHGLGQAGHDHGGPGAAAALRALEGATAAPAGALSRDRGAAAVEAHLEGWRHSRSSGGNGGRGAPASSSASSSRDIVEER